MSASLRLAFVIVWLALQLLLSMSSTAAQCLQFDYAVQHVQSVVARSPLPHPQSLTAVDEGVTVVSLPFAFPFYGQMWTSANVSTNGNIQFGSYDELYEDSPFPIEAFAAAIAFYQIDLDPDYNTTQEVGLLVSTPGQRVWLLRLTDDAYCPFAPTDGGDDFHNNTAADDLLLDSSPHVNIDVLLYETGTIEVRYYVLNPSYYDLNIGLQSAPDANGDRQMSIVVDSIPANTTIPTIFSNSTLTFTPFCASTTVAPTVMMAQLCFIFYSLPGTADYPFSSATSVTIQYDPVPVQTAAGTAVHLLRPLGPGRSPTALRPLPSPASPWPPRLRPTCCTCTALSPWTRRAFRGRRPLPYSCRDCPLYPSCPP